MATIIDSYSESNQNASTSLATGTSGTAYGQCFTGDGQKIVSVRFYIAKVSFPTGNVIARIYAMTGTFGVNGTVGTLLGTSDNVNAASMSGPPALQTFTFTGAQQYVTTVGTHYVVSCEFTGGDPSNFFNLYYDSTGTHPGTWTFRNGGGTWTPVDAGIDFCFYVDGVPAAVDVTVNLTGVAGSPAIGTGTVEIGAAPVEPPVTPGGGTGAGRPARTGMRLRPTEDKAVYLTGVAANPKVGHVMLLSEMAKAYEAYSLPIRRAEARKPAEMPPGMRRLFKPVEKPIPPALFVYQVGLPKLRSAVGVVTVKAFYEEIDEEVIAMIDQL